MNTKDNKTLPAFLVEKVQERPGWRLVTPNHPQLYPIGRFDTRDPEAIVFIWQGTEIRARFYGRSIGFRFSNGWGQNFFNVILDGKIRVLQLAEGAAYDYLLGEEAPDGWHELILNKRTEGKFSGCVFHGFLLNEAGRLGPKPEPLPLRIEFYGDSITAGACIEDAGPDQYTDFSTHNNYRSYGAITARDLNAEYVCIAISGIGVSYSWNTLLLEDIYERLYPDPNGPKYAFGDRKPDIVVVNIGQNDYGYSVIKDVAFPTDFTEKYVRVVGNIRSLYPDARIVCAMGGMSAMKDSVELQEAFKKALAELQGADAKIYSLVFTEFSFNHPRTDTHKKMATQLTAFLKKEFLLKK